MAKELPPVDIGIYGITVVSISYAMYAVGLDFYTYSTRDLIQRPKSEWFYYIKKQIKLILINYLALLPIIFILLVGFISPIFSLLVIVIIIVEHINQESMRLLIADNRAFLASNILFVRSGLWCYVSVVLMEYGWVAKNILSVLVLWLIFSIVALALSIYSLKYIFSIKEKINKVKPKWLSSGLKVCIPLLVSTLMMRTITTIDRFWMEKIDGLELVGVYSFYFGVAGSLIAFLDSGVFSFYYPKLIAVKNNFLEFKLIVREMLYKTVIITFLISLVLCLIVPYILMWIDKEIYISNTLMFYVVLIANIFYCLSMIPHYILYAKSFDKAIVFSHAVSLLVFILFAIVFVEMAVSLSIVYSVLISYLFLFLVKCILVYILESKS
ncbi:lipopolysaccharide biosynthesis protein [Acinetobacter indicus]|uniref:lipopolysaccharide biosynthesis protein n=1 Tax=Acinetobacter indicus TaxID=756892 RepID=UPI0014439E9A|nr:hypothetical protein [Acinetobacter indicus]